MSDGNRIVGDTEDLISRLPDDLLNNILSLLPLKTVISTSVLSRRWNTLWATVPSLDLNVSDFLPRGNDLTSQTRRKANFLAFVERYLGLNWPCNIDILHLNFFDDQVRPEISGIKLVWSKADPRDYQNHPPFPLEVFRHSHSDLESWIVLAERLKAHTLYISSMINTLVRPNLFTFESLGSLTLVGSMALNIPEASTFPNLRTLILEDIIVKGDDSVSNLINSCCPVLEELWVSSYGDEKDLDLLVVTAKSLRRLDLEFFGDDMTTSSTVSVTRIDFSALRSLSLQNVLITDNQSGEILDGLEEADLDVSSDDGNCLFWLLTMIRNVKKLILSDCTLGSLKSCTLPTFDYLTCLKIEELDNDRAIWESLIMVLKKSPMLEDFSLEGLSFDSSRVFDSTVDHNIPRCLTSCLKTIEISPVCGRKKELEIVAYFLKHSQVLQTMIVMVEKTGFEKMEVKKEILALPKGSPQCDIIFK